MADEETTDDESFDDGGDAGGDEGGGGAAYAGLPDVILAFGDLSVKLDEVTAKLIILEGHLTSVIALAKQLDTGGGGGGGDTSDAGMGL